MFGDEKQQNEARRKSPRRLRVAAAPASKDECAYDECQKSIRAPEVVGQRHFDHANFFFASRFCSASRVARRFLAHARALLLQCRRALALKF